MVENLVSNAEENVVKASMRWAASPVSEEDGVTPNISGASSFIPDKLDLFMQWMSQQMKEQSQEMKEQKQELRQEVRGPSEPLTQLEQEMESLVHRAYPTAQEDILNLLARDCFVDAFQDLHLQICVKQDVQEALTRVSEMKAFLKTTTDALRLVLSRYEGGIDTLSHHGKARLID
ncbi:hypothetical protein E2C01_067684 [Portunus trituberculatus]|uniref:Uncharacterized protein n=1 Tax=Portunus trituberculatus TaxID=210409 RepID=A0A5B7HXD9_PORTR|nr:hypothetical protein [Portunus trituberculatus]